MQSSTQTITSAQQTPGSPAGRAGGRGRVALGELAEAFSERLTAGAMAGLSAGLLVLVASMGWAVHRGRPPAAPLAAAATIFNVAPKPTPTPDNLAVGLITHLTLTVLFGVGFAALLVALRGLGLASSWKGSAPWAVGYGLMLYVLNFQILGRTAFPVFSHLQAADQAFNVAKHALFGLLLLPFFPKPQRRDHLTVDAR